MLGFRVLQAPSFSKKKLKIESRKDMVPEGALNKERKKIGIDYMTDSICKAWLCKPEITLNFYVLFILWYLHNLNRHSHFLDLTSSRFNFWISWTYMPLFSYLMITNVCLLLEPLSDLLIIMSNPNFQASMQTHSNIRSQGVNSCSFLIS